MTASAYRSFWLSLVTAMFLTIGLIGTAAATEPEAIDPTELRETLTKTLDGLQAGLQEIEPASQSTTGHCDALAAQALELLAFARDALEKGDITLASDSLSVARGMIAVSLAELPDPPAPDLSNKVRYPTRRIARSELRHSGFRPNDIKNVKDLVDRIATERSVPVNIPEAMGRLEQAGFDMARLERTLGEANLSATDVSLSLKAELKNMATLSTGLNDLLRNPSMRTEFATELRDLAAHMGVDLQNALEAVTDIRDAIESSDGLDLDAIAGDIGFENFADFVDAFNQAYGTNITESQAREALE